jgi:hypothetical protein
MTDQQFEAGGGFVALSECWVHKGIFEFDPDTVLTILIDPRTRLPTDVDADGNKITQDPAAIERSVQQPICPRCVALLDAEAVRRGMTPVSER